MSDPASDVIKKALTDPSFRARLLADPTATVEKATGLKLPPGTSVKVLEDSASAVHLVLPRLDPAPKGALGDAELSKVAGGGIARFTFQCSGNSSLTMFRVC